MRPRAGLALLAITLACSRPTPPIEPIEPIDAYFTRYVDAHQFAGVVLVERGDRVVLRKAYGEADPAMPFPIASVTKTFTGAAVALLAREGRLRLTDSLARWIPEYPEAARVTIDQLLRHRSGVPTVDNPDVFLEGVEPLELVRRMRMRPLAFEPGSNDEYSSQAYTLLALVIERASGTPYARFVRERLTDPAGMTATGDIRANRPDATRPVLPRGHQGGVPGSLAVPIDVNEVPDLGGGSMYATAEDLSRWLRAVERDQPLPLDSLAYPYGWGRRTYDGHTLIEQTGQVEGFGSYIALYRKDRVRVVVLSSVQSGLFNRIGPDIARLIFGGDTPAPPQVHAVQLARERLDEFAGTYRSPGNNLPMILRVNHGRLDLQWGTYPFRRIMVPIGDDAFFYPSEYARVRFTRDSARRVTSSVWQWDGGERVVYTRE